MKVWAWVANKKENIHSDDVLEEYGEYDDTHHLTNWIISSSSGGALYLQLSLPSLLPSLLPASDRYLLWLSLSLSRLLWCPWLIPGNHPMTQDDPWVTQDDPWVTQDDPWMTQDDPRVTQDDPWATQDELRVSQDNPRMTQGDPG